MTTEAERWKIVAAKLAYMVIEAKYPELIEAEKEHEASLLLTHALEREAQGN